MKSKGKFNTKPPEDAERFSNDEDLNGPPPVISPCLYLREKATGMIHAYNEAMARRGDLVEAFEGDPDEVDAKPKLKRGPKKMDKESVAPPPPPPSLDEFFSKEEIDAGIPVSA